MFINNKRLSNMSVIIMVSVLKGNNQLYNNIFLKKFLLVTKVYTDRR